MTNHAESELLSAYIDGELTSAEHASVGSHLSTCADCREIHDALRSTILDLSALDDVTMTDEEVAALDAHLAANRTASTKPRWIWTGTAVAASLLALAIGINIAQRPDQALRNSATGAGSALDAVNAVPFEQNSTNYSAATAKAALDSIPSATMDRSGTTGLAAPANPEAAATAKEDAYSAEASGALERCVAEVQKGSPDGVVPIRYELAKYNGSPAFLMFFKAPEAKPTRIEIWVMRESDCFTLYFAQRAQ